MVPLIVFDWYILSKNKYKINPYCATLQLIFAILYYSYEGSYIEKLPLPCCTKGRKSRPTMVAGGFWKSLGLWLYESPVECTGAFHTPWATPPPLGLVEIRRGDEQLMLFRHCSFCYTGGNSWILEIARPVVVRVPSRVYRRLPHTMGNAASAWFGRKPSGGRAVNAFPTL